MYKRNMYFIEGLRNDWSRELKIGNPGRILRLAFFTIVYGAVYLFPSLGWLVHADIEPDKDRRK
jgi:hypothetical protein